MKWLDYAIYKQGFINTVRRYTNVYSAVKYARRFGCDAIFVRPTGKFVRDWDLVWTNDNLRGDVIYPNKVVFPDWVGM